MTTLRRADASAAVAEIGWRDVGGGLYTVVVVRSLDQALAVAAIAVSACGADADSHLRVDLRADAIALVLQPPSGFATDRDIELAHGVTDAIRDLGLDTQPRAAAHPVQSFEVAIDALDIGAIRPFWQAILGYTDEIVQDTPTNALFDPLRQGPAVWFQQMDEPRPQRNRIHFDLLVAHDAADARIEAALAAGGRMVSDRRARAFWILADPEGNEICVCTWQDRD